MTTSFNDAEGRPVVSADTAEDMGEVKGFVVDTSATRVEAIHVSGRGRRAELLAWDSVRSFGVDAVIAQAADAAERAADDHEKQAAKGNIALRKTRVLTTQGFEIGTVGDAHFDADSGALVAVTTDQGSIDASRFRSLGSYALVVDPE